MERENLQNIRRQQLHGWRSFDTGRSRGCRNISFHHKPMNLNTIGYYLLHNGKQLMWRFSLRFLGLLQLYTVTISTQKRRMTFQNFSSLFVCNYTTSIFTCITSIIQGVSKQVPREMLPKCCPRLYQNRSECLLNGTLHFGFSYQGNAKSLNLK